MTNVFQLSWNRDRRRAEVTLREGRTSVVVDRLRMVDADGEGRLLRAVFGPSTWRRSYANRYVEIRSEAISGERFHVPVEASLAEGQSLLAQVRTLIDEVRGAATQGAITGFEPPDADASALDAALGRICAFDEARLAADGERFQQLYPALSPLPPDQQTALVLRLTSDLAAHARDVLAFLGSARAMRHGAFIDAVSDASALHDAVTWLRTHVLHPEERVAANLIVPEGASIDGSAFARTGITQVYLPLRAVDAAALEAFHTREIRVSLVAPAPTDLASAHALARDVGRFDLRGGDTLYSLEPVPYPREAATRVALRAAFHAFKAALTLPEPPNGPVVTHFPIVQSVY